MTSCGNRATWTASAAVALATSVSGILPSAQAGPDEPEQASPGYGRQARPADADFVDLQQQLDELRSSLPHEREQRIGRRLEATGAVLVVPGIVIGVGGLWFYAKFRAVAADAKIGAAAARHSVRASRGLLAESEMPRESSGERIQPFPRRASVGLEADAAPRANANGSYRGGSPTPPRLQAFPYPLWREDRDSPAGRAGPGLDDADLRRVAAPRGGTEPDEPSLLRYVQRHRELPRTRTLRSGRLHGSPLPSLLSCAAGLMAAQHCGKALGNRGRELRET